MKTIYVSQASVEALAEDIGAVTGELQAGFDGLAEMHARMGERIANLEQRVAELTPKPRARRSTPRRRKLHDVLAAAE